MHCPKCSKPVELTIDQALAGMATIGSGIFIAKGGGLAMIAIPYLLPVMIGGLAWSAMRKAACPYCGHRFTYWEVVGKP